MFRKFRKPHWVYSVLYESNSERYECFCKLWNSIEIPCSHIICVLKELEKDALSMRLVLKRWCKDVNSGSFHDSDRGLDSNRAFWGQFDGEDILDPKIIKSNGAPRSNGNGKRARQCRRCYGFRHVRRNCTANKEDMLDEVSVKFEVVNGDAAPLPNNATTTLNISTWLPVINRLNGQPEAKDFAPYVFMSLCEGSSITVTGVELQKKYFQNGSISSVLYYRSCSQKS
ncbi:hypothetical protein HN873_019811 [Arachis hypogaea]